MGVDKGSEAVVPGLSSAESVEGGVVRGLVCDEYDVAFGYRCVFDEGFEVVGGEAEAFAAVSDEVVVVEVDDLFVDVCDAVGDE